MSIEGQLLGGLSHPDDLFKIPWLSLGLQNILRGVVTVRVSFDFTLLIIIILSPSYFVSRDRSKEQMGQKIDGKGCLFLPPN